MPKIDKPVPKPIVKVVPVVKVAPKAIPTKKLPEKKAPTPTKLPPKAIAKPIAKKIPTKPLNTLPDKLEVAADREGLWVRDLIKFPDLLAKHGLPKVIATEDVEKAHALSRFKVSQTFLKFN